LSETDFSIIYKINRIPFAFGTWSSPIEILPNFKGTYTQNRIHFAKHASPKVENISKGIEKPHDATSRGQKSFLG
jgi:hypothetical protein